MKSGISIILLFIYDPRPGKFRKKDPHGTIKKEELRFIDNNHSWKLFWIINIDILSFFIGLIRNNIFIKYGKLFHWNIFQAHFLLPMDHMSIFIFFWWSVNLISFRKLKCFDQSVYKQTFMKQPCAVLRNHIILFNLHVY